MPTPGAKRRTLRQSQQDHFQLNAFERAQIFDDINRVLDRSQDRRFGAVSTSKEKDFVLDRYQDYIRLLKGLGQQSNNDDVNQHAFTTNLEDLTRQLCEFMVYTFRYESPHSNEDEWNGTLSQYRDYILEWVDWQYKRLHPEVPRPNQAGLKRDMTHAMVR